jgi:hypothetical protein
LKVKNLKTPNPKSLKNKNLKTPKSKKPGKGGGDRMNGGVGCPFCSHGKPIT